LRGKRHKAGGVIYIENKQERAGVPVLEALVFSCEQNRGVRGRTWDGGWGWRWHTVYGLVYSFLQRLAELRGECSTRNAPAAYTDQIYIFFFIFSFLN
jgi:hypothetical protein